MEKFSYETNGYNRAEVNQFITDIIVKTEGIIEKVRNQEAEIESLKKELRHYKNIEDTLKSAIIKAEEIGDNIKKAAREESDMIISDAKNNASRIVNEALLKAEKVENHTDILENNIRIYKTKLKLLIEQQLAIVDKIEVKEIDDSE